MEWIGSSTVARRTGAGRSKVALKIPGVAVQVRIPGDNSAVQVAGRAQGGSLGMVVTTLQSRLLGEPRVVAQ